MQPPQVAEAAPAGRADMSERRTLRADVFEWFGEEWASILFVVCLVSVLAIQGPLRPLSHVSLLTLAYFHATFTAQADSDASESAQIWLYGIGPVDYEERYGERRPLSRCTLEKDLKSLIKDGPRVLVVDLDLSPLPQTVETDREHRCQETLEDLLTHHASGTHVVLMEPFDVAKSPQKQQWQAKLEKQGKGALSFGEATIEYPLNVALEYECQETGLAEVAYRAATGSRPRCRRGDTHPINYRALRDHVYPMPTSSAPTPASAPAGSARLSGKTVFFGLQAGPSDLAVTPIGEAHGVVVHAAKYATFFHELPHRELIGFAVDLFFAAAFSLFIHWFTRRYLRHASAHDPVGRAYLAVLMLGFGIMYLALVLLALGVAWRLAVGSGLILEPLLIAVGLGLDGFVIAGWAHVGGARREHASVTHPARDEALGPMGRWKRWRRDARRVRERCRRSHSLWLRLAPVWLWARWIVFWVIVGREALHLMGVA